MTDKPSVLITGASSGIGATYAERFAARGHGLVLAARDVAKLEALASRLRADHGVTVDVVRTDLTTEADIAALEARLAADAAIGILVNNAGASLAGGFLDQTAQAIDDLIRLNITAVARLARAAAKRFATEGKGAIVNIASVVGLAPEFGMTVYGATKAFVIYLSQSLQVELGKSGVYVQAVLPAATRTAIWNKTESELDAMSGLMAVGDLVDAALAGFDRREDITIPPLPDAATWDAHEAARKALLPGFGNAKPAARYRTA
jgi:short-subunit dehydrogenase